MNRLLFFSLLVFSCCTLSGTAQSSSWRMDYFLGPAAYVGDVADSPFYSENWKPAIGLGLQYELRKPLFLKFNVLYGQLSGDDQYFDTPDWPSGDRLSRFTTSFTDLNFSLVYHFLESESLEMPRKISPYLAIGGGLINFKPKPVYGSTRNPELEQVLLDDTAENYSNTSGQFSLEAGVDWRIIDRWSIGLSAAVYPTSTDYLDGISWAGNPDKRDLFALAGLRLQYRFASIPDSDKDGIADHIDLCPQSPGLADMEGCPDSDRDGLHDDEDLCPLLAGNLSLGGCPDHDGDGIADKDDLCPSDFGPFTRGGCPIEDRDGDGIEDNKDLCPDVAGPPEREGCPVVDSDQDGILDEDDRCRFEFGLSIFGGCPDTDGDGIENSRDACPTIFGVYTHNGCPEVIHPDEVATEINRQYLLFEFGKADIPRYSLLDQIVRFLKDNPSYQLTINGFTDSEGNLQNNQQLSRARARACYRYLSQQGISERRMEYKGLGLKSSAEHEVQKNAAALNRRVEFFIFK